MAGRTQARARELQTLADRCSRTRRRSRRIAASWRVRGRRSRAAGGPRAEAKSSRRCGPVSTRWKTRAGGLEKGLDYMLLNFPLMDLLEPDLKVEQVMLSGLYHDINFTDIDRVDRCVTCHVAANRAASTARSGRRPSGRIPRLDSVRRRQLAASLRTFGCTDLSRGLDRATDFARAGHSPIDEESRHAGRRSTAGRRRSTSRCRFCPPSTPRPAV